MSKTPIILERPPVPRIEVINLIDVLITLIAFFMLTTVFHENGTVGINLPKARHGAGAGTAGNVLVVELTKERRIFIQGHAVDETGLRKILKEQNPETVVTIRADKDCSYERVINLLDLVKESNMSRVALEVRKSKESGGL